MSMKIFLHCHKTREAGASVSIDEVLRFSNWALSYLVCVLTALTWVGLLLHYIAPLALVFFSLV